MIRVNILNSLAESLIQVFAQWKQNHAIKIKEITGLKGFSKALSYFIIEYVVQSFLQHCQTPREKDSCAATSFIMLESKNHTK